MSTTVIAIIATFANIIGIATGIFICRFLNSFILRGELWVNKKEGTYRFEVDDLSELDTHTKLLIDIRHRD